MAEEVATPLVLPVRFQCPLCFDVLREPIQLPCCRRHLCLVCFERALELTSVFCGFCRRRIVGFARKKQNKVDQTLWLAIRERCPFLDGDSTAEHQPEPVVEFIDEDEPTGDRGSQQQQARTGEVRQFYEQQLRKHQSERQHQDALALEQTMHFLQSDPEYVSSLATTTFSMGTAPNPGTKTDDGAKQQRLDAFFGSPNKASAPSPSSTIPAMSLQKQRSSLPTHRISSSSRGFKAKRRKSWTPPTGLLQLKLSVPSTQKPSPAHGVASKKPAVKRPWMCPQCTFENTCFDRRCSMCLALPGPSANSQ